MTLIEQVVCKHPLVAHKMSILRDKCTKAKEFRELIEEVTVLLGMWASQDLDLQQTVQVSTVRKYKRKVLATLVF